MSTILLPPPLLANGHGGGRHADPETMLVAVYKDLAANRLRQAQATADALIQAYPTFRLGHLIRGDLLLMHTRPVTTFGTAPNAADQLADLRTEALARLKWLRERPDPQLVPRPLLRLRDDQKNALVVDAKRSRLYVYENRGGQPKFVKDYYISQGKLGIHKRAEADKKTPVGIYYINGHLPNTRLPDFYGLGALPINYPNEWDRLHGRGGSGIWLHGTPSDNFSRPPLSSDGCVVLTNPDLRQLFNMVEIGKTPDVISEQVEFVDQGKWEADRKAAAGLVSAWRRAVESRDVARVLAHYSNRFKSPSGEDLHIWFAKQRHILSGSGSSGAPRDVSFFLYPDRESMIVATLTLDVLAGKSRQTIRKRQYWAKEGSRWKIVSEMPL